MSEITEVLTHYHSGDINLGIRRLLDYTLDTRDLTIFESTLAFIDWEEQHRESSTSECHERLNNLVTKISKAKVVNTANTPLLVSLHSIGKTFPNFSLNEVSLEINSGELIGLVGENGNGKTTLLRMIAGDLNLSSGMINYHFIPNDASDYSIKSQLVYMPQRIPKWRGSVMDNLQFTLSCYGIKGEANRIWAELMIARLGLREFRQFKWSEISSGYKTRFELAKVLLQQPKIILLDEPLANLDINAQQTILQDLKFLAQSKSNPFAVVLSSQQLYEVERISDKVIFLKNGMPQYLNLQTAANDTATAIENATPSIAIVYELETNASKEALQAAFSAHSLDQIHFNGGIYFLHFTATISNQEVLHCLATAAIEVNYIRNISNSSRRFFIN